MTSKSFTGGEALQKRLAEMAAKLSKAASVRVGFLEGATEPDGASIPMIAAIQEFGAPRAGIPPRPFFRSMIEDKKGGWGDAVASNLKATSFDAEAALGLMGEEIANDLQESIIKTTAPPLSPVTLMLRKMRSEDQSLVVTGKVVGEAAARVKAGEGVGDVSTKPLEDTKNMLHSVSYEVKS